MHLDLAPTPNLGPIQVLRKQWGCVSFPGKNCYEGVMFNVISLTRGWVGVKFPEMGKNKQTGP